MSSYQQQFDHPFIKISEDIQTNDQALDRILEQLARLQGQATIQRTLVSTAQILSSHPKNSALPNQLATRVKHIIKFVYEKPSRNEARSVHLRKLECNALKFCGLAYTIRNLLRLPELQFEYLVEYVAEFVNSRGLVQHLYRSDINKIIDQEIVAEDEQLFREFLTGGCTKAKNAKSMQLTEPANARSRPLKRPSLVDKDNSTISNDQNAVVSAEPTLSALQDSHDHMPSHTRPPKRQREEVTDGASASTEPTLVASTELVARDPPSQISHECKFNTFSSFDIALLRMLMSLGRGTYRRSVQVNHRRCPGSRPFRSSW